MRCTEYVPNETTLQLVHADLNKFCDKKQLLFFSSRLDDPFQAYEIKFLRVKQ